ncbi:hypothetical protein [Methylorubrum populi]|uniref:hypothetical protein n=1 Tax=Methylorubrum populi TaxID=223967 RepID=UPI001FCEEEDD|nr:hypothetical protein [Methylorubrum populi]
MSYLPIVLKAFAVMLIAASLLPLVPTNLGFIRTLDFPRFQCNYPGVRPALA